MGRRLHGVPRETLAPRPGNRILDVGCGEGLAEVEIGRLHISQLRLVGIDLVPSKVAAARQETLVAQPARRICGGRRLPSAVQGRRVRFDLLRRGPAAHRRVDTAVAEFARVTATKGRVVAVEPDNTRAVRVQLDAAGTACLRVVGAVLHRPATVARGDRSAIGPTLPDVFARHGIEPLVGSAVSRYRDTLSVRRRRRRGRRDARRSKARCRTARSDAAAWLGREYSRRAHGDTSAKRMPPGRRSSRFRTRCSSRPWDKSP